MAEWTAGKVKRLCAPDLGEDEYDQMEAKDIPKNWPDHLDEAVKQLSDRILSSTKFSPNELLLGSIVNSGDEPNPEDITKPTENNIALHLAYVEQQRLDSYSEMVNHAIKRKQIFNRKVLRRAPREIIFKTGDLVQVYRSDLMHTVITNRKLAPMWSVPRRILTQKVNSYTLKTLTGTPLNGVYHACRLRAFQPREGTKLALSEATRHKAPSGEGRLREGENEVDEGSTLQEVEAGDIEE
jgi:hypothetical protein